MCVASPCDRCALKGRGDGSSGGQGSATLATCAAKGSEDHAQLWLMRTIVTIVTVATNWLAEPTPIVPYYPRPNTM